MRAAAALVPALLVALGCGASSEGPEHARAGYLYQRTPTGAQAGCPMAIVGAELDVIDLDDGVAMEFRSDDDSDVVDVRNRTRNLAASHYTAISGKQGNPSFDVAVYDIEGGARIELHPSNRNNVESLQRQARMDESVMHAGSCAGLETSGAY